MHMRNLQKLVQRHIMYTCICAPKVHCLVQKDPYSMCPKVQITIEQAGFVTVELTTIGEETFGLYRNASCKFLLKRLLYIQLVAFIESVFKSQG